MLAEYDFSRARGNKYAGRYAKGTLVVTLDPDVAAVFPGAAQVNEALRALAVFVKKCKTRPGVSSRPRARRTAASAR